MILWVACAILTAGETGAYDRLQVDFSGEIARMGKDGPPLEGDVFYDYIGETKLRDAYRESRYFLDRLGFVGSQTVGPAILLAGVGAIGFACSDDHWSCSPAFDVLMWTGVGLTVGATVLMMIAVLGDPHPVDLDTRRALADDYNNTLRQHETRSWRLVPSVLPTGQSLTLAIDF